MMTNNPSLDLVEFIETQILPQYAAFDKAHNMEHVTRVIRRSLELARKTGVDINMAYTIAAYHDLGLTRHHAHPVASTERWWLRLTATSSQKPSSVVPSSMDWPTIHSWTMKVTGSASCNTWTRNTL